MATSKQRALKAFKAMKKLGIPTEKIMINLKKLFEIYDKNWDLIERNNYGSLADYIFEAIDKEEAGEDHKVKEEDVDAGKSGSKRPCLELDNGKLIKVPKSVTFARESDLVTYEGGCSKGLAITTHKTARNPDPATSSLEIASTDVGEVKLFMRFKNIEQPNFNAVCRELQRKYMKTYQIKNPNFSIKKLLNELCEACSEDGMMEG